MASLGGGGGGRGRGGAGGRGGAPATMMMNRRVKFPPGFRFIPTDVELVVHYLRLKKAGLPLAYDIITEVDIKDHHPEELIETYRSMGEHRWYFFTKRQKKYLNGSRPSRTAKNGFWKATGADQKIKDREVTVGMKRSLVFYDGTPRDGIKTDWIMYEYRIDDVSKKTMPDRNTMTLDDWVLCTIQKKRGADKSTPNQMREVVEAGDTANEEGGCDGAENAERDAAGIQEPDGGRDEGKSAKRGAEEDGESSELKRQKREDNGATLEPPPAETTDNYRESSDGGRDEGKSAKRGAEEDEESSELKRQKREDNEATLEPPPAETTDNYRESSVGGRDDGKSAKRGAEDEESSELKRQKREDNGATLEPPPAETTDNYRESSDGGRDEGKSEKRGAEEDEESSELKRQKREDNGATLEPPPAETTDIYRELDSADFDGLPDIQFSELEGVDDELLMKGPILDPADWIWEYVQQGENLVQCNLEKKETEKTQEEEGRNLDISQTNM